MGTQRKLNALLFELQTAQSPLAQAKILARSWRTLRELSPTDRRLLSRHAGFDGAEQILEGLGAKRGGFAPAMLLQMLNKVRSDDGAELSELLVAMRDPARRDEALRRGADMAVDLLDEGEESQEGQEDRNEIDEALEELHTVEKALDGIPEKALISADVLEPESAKPDANGASIPPGPSPDRPTPGAPLEEPSGSAGGVQPVEKSAEFQQTVSAAVEEERTATPVRAPGVVFHTGWDELRGAESPEPSGLTPVSGDERRGSSVVPSSQVESLPAHGEQASVLLKFRSLHREIDGNKIFRRDDLQQLLESFPDGWARRRALTALIDSGVPADPVDAVDLIAMLGRENDRQWCLGALARRGVLKGAVAEESLGLLSSSWARRRIQKLALEN